jgi:high-affinity nickel-transport protein
MLTRIFHDEPGDAARRIAVVYLLLIAASVAAWVWALLAFREHPLLLGTSLLAYGFGIRHAIDADHIAAIDNVTRKLMQEGKRPFLVGFFFSLGHSTVVILATLAIAATAKALSGRVDDFHRLGSTIGTMVSAVFLLAIAVMNLFILVAVYRTFHRVRRGAPYVEEDLDTLVGGGGVLGRIFRPLFGMIRKSWHMYPLGFLFGLGFDTATEIGLLGISAAEAARGMPIWSILVFPALFTTGMALVDTTDSVLMLGAYGWAFTKPVRKLYYNLTITFISVVVALLIGGIEALGLVAARLNLHGAFWDTVSALAANIGNMGYIIIGVFVLSWIVSFVIYRVKGYDRVVAPVQHQP